MANLQIPTAWNRIVVDAERFTSNVLRTGDIVLPPLRRAPGLPAELSGLMPSRDHNGDLLLAIERMSHCLPADRPVIGMFAADPFLRIDQLAGRLAQKGYRDVANLPSVTQYGIAFRPVLNGLNVGPAREFKALDQFAALGFAVSVSVAHIDDVAPALALAPAQLFVVPSFDLWCDGKLDPGGLLTLCGQVAEHRQRAASRAPIVLFAGHTGISPMQARNAGADGIVLD